MADIELPVFQLSPVLFPSMPQGIRDLLKPLIAQAAIRRSVQRLAKRSGTTHSVLTVSTE